MRTGNAGRYNKSGRTGMVNTATVLRTGNNKYGNLLSAGKYILKFWCTAYRQG